MSPTRPPSSIANLGRRIMDHHRISKLVVDEVLAERLRQIGQEGYTLARDDHHRKGQLRLAGACYALYRPYSSLWPWQPECFKSKGHRQNLIIAAALLVAEIERLDRRDQRRPA